MAMLTVGAARADRIVLAPEANTVVENGLKGEFAVSPSRDDEDLTWLQFSSPYGIELEGERAELRNDDKKRYSFNIEYPVIQQYDRMPSISIGIRDLLATGLERESPYAVATETIKLPSGARKRIKDFKLTFGAGIGYIGGPFVGAQTRLRSGLGLDVELFRGRPNVGISLPLIRNLQVKTSSLNGGLFYGLSFVLVR